MPRSLLLARLTALALGAALAGAFAPAAAPLRRGRALAAMSSEQAAIEKMLAEKQAAYEAEAKAKAKAKAVAESGGDSVALSSLPLVPYLDDDGKITDCGAAAAGAKASVYAVSDEAGAVQYVGVSRAAQPSLKAHLIRKPGACYGFRIHHLQRPSRAALELVQDAWIAETAAPGNDGGAEQNLWENPLDFSKLMTEEDKEMFEDYDSRGKPGMGMKKIAKRFEKDIKDTLSARGCVEHIKWSVKLKETGVLDLST